MTKGSIYVDNIRAVYGEKVDDLHPPVIESLNVEGKEFTTNAVNLRADVKEFEDDPFKTGIDWENITSLSMARILQSVKAIIPMIWMALFL